MRITTLAKCCWAFVCVCGGGGGVTCIFNFLRRFLNHNKVLAQHGSTILSSDSQIETPILKRQK